MAKTIFDGQTRHSIEHLAPFSFTYSRPAKGDDPAWEKEISVAFSWHCYTRTPDEIEQVYRLRSGREERCFCPDRYALSFKLPGIMASLHERHVAQTGRGNYVTVEIVTDTGERIEYGVFFSLRKGSHKEPLKLMVESAYPFGEAQKRPRVSRQKIRFRVLVYNIWRGKPIKLFR